MRAAYFSEVLIIACGPGSSVGIATDYGMDGPGSNPGGDEIFRPSRPALGPTQPPVKWVQGLSWGLRAAGACCWPLTPLKCCGRGRVELNLYPPSGPHRACNGITLPLPLLIIAYWSTRRHFSADSDFNYSHSNKSMFNLLMSNFQA
jgi:hypothetical protein